MNKKEYTFTKDVKCRRVTNIMRIRLFNTKVSEKYTINISWKIASNPMYISRHY